MDKEVARWDPITINGSASKWGSPISAVPQDPVLGLLNIFNNDTDSENESHPGILQRTPG